ncbi:MULTISPECIES: response regulator [Pseudomonas]|uniref:Histidine kinase n=1 Tax=Pseudomonas putida TaxID=303 RepID=A0A1B2FAD5_PSEPU|nr:MULTISPECIES: response regulator [Pseudomonas]ANY89096.1 hypothetical protein IEC33019_3576 [Pseudomonas putida]MCL8308733.1 response regulator [Pseudomonas putida]
MHWLNVLIHARPSHDISLHQACNAQGVFNVRVAQDLAEAKGCLSQRGIVDLLILDHGLPVHCGRTLLRQVAQAQRPCALLFVGQSTDHGEGLAREARRQGVRVVGELSWPLVMPSLQRALERIHQGSEGHIQTVMYPAHAH